MSHTLSEKLVIAVASSALFDLSESDRIFRKKGVNGYKKYQEANIDVTLEKGVAFPFIKRILKINSMDAARRPIEVILLSRNSAETGLRVFRSITHHGLDITRGALLSGGPPHRFIKPLGVDLFLSGNSGDVREACANNCPAGHVLAAPLQDDEDDDELRVAFDFDGVIGGDSAERVFQERGLDAFQESETEKCNEPLEPGPLAKLLNKLSILQAREKIHKNRQPEYKCFLRTSIITARNAPAHERLINTLKNWHVDVDDVFLLGGLEKAMIINEIRPHIFFDDQPVHLKGLKTPAVHIPFGVKNQSSRPFET